MSEIKYEKVTGSIFDLKEEFENGELYIIELCTVNRGFKYTQIESEYDFAKAIFYGDLRRQVKPKKTEIQNIMDLQEKKKADGYDRIMQGGD